MLLYIIIVAARHYRSLITSMPVSISLIISLVVDFASHYLIIAITDYRPEHMSISPPMPLAGKIIKITMVVAISTNLFLCKAPLIELLACLTRLPDHTSAA